ncbi:MULTISPECIES: hypothetical protein [Streptomyces]|uniref:hypothetical protein n=1 Tax=Streptomyces TaxID=1883 RepID=UPI00068E6CF7|nr:hypothetical protein [Streptomyces durhamensis]
MASQVLHSRNPARSLSVRGVPRRQRRPQTQARAPIGYSQPVCEAGDAPNIFDQPFWSPPHPPPVHGAGPGSTRPPDHPASGTRGDRGTAHPGTTMTAARAAQGTAGRPRGLAAPA